MKRIAIKQVDAFTTVPFGGNPAGVVTDASGLTEAEMQAIAREMNLSETAFVTPCQAADFRVRFFTPLKEIGLAGHPTIATMHALVEEGRIPLREGTVVVTQELRVGVLPVEIHVSGGAVGRIVMTQKRPEFHATYPHQEWAAALGVAPEDLDTRYPVQTVSTGTPQLMALVKDLAVLERMKPDFNRMAELTERGDFFSIHVFCLGGYSPEADVHARHFAPTAGVAEDPVTGSASGGMGAYLVKYGLVDKARLVAEQGHIIGRPGTVYVEVERQGQEVSLVKVGGQAVTVMTGELFF
ncbi:MAG: PhzF family phenazine biosynthesis protein [Chloroflexota bacterium]